MSYFPETEFEPRMNTSFWLVRQIWGAGGVVRGLQGEFHKDLFVCMIAIELVCSDKLHRKYALPLD